MGLRKLSERINGILSRLRTICVAREEVGNPCGRSVLRPLMDSITNTFELALRGACEGGLTARGPTGGEINGFLHIDQPPEDPLLKLEAMRSISGVVRSHNYRRAEHGALNALYASTYATYGSTRSWGPSTTEGRTPTSSAPSARIWWWSGQ